MTLPVHVDIEASLASLARNDHVQPDGMLKLWEDLYRYAAIIEATGPQIIIETGTRSGASARWFARRAERPRVVTIDISHDELVRAGTPFMPLLGNSIDPGIVARVTELVGSRRCMVVLDSDHSAAHVTAEIRAYAPLVTPGCYLVVEDGIFGYASQEQRDWHLPGLVGSPLDAIAAELVPDPGWVRDTVVEELYPITHHPNGFWRRRES